MTRPSFLAELKRRNVIRVAIAYVAVSWLVLQAGALSVQVLELPNSVSKVLYVLLVIGFIPAMVFSWVYELTPEGLKRESEVESHESITHLTGRKLDYIVIGVLGAVVALLLVDKFVVTPRLAARAAASAPAQPAPASPPAQAEPTAAPARSSIAVLPFVNMSSDKEQEYFSDGISEELLNLLAKIPQLHVAARTSSFSFKGKDAPIPEIARTLMVAHVLEGSVRKSGEQVRITAQLVRASDGYHLWSETYDRRLDDIFKVQDEIAGAVVAQLQVKLLGAAPTAKPVDPKAYPLILQAQALLDRQSAEGRTQAIELCRQALQLSPGEARAWACLSRAYLNQMVFGELTSAQAAPLVKEAANKALAADPGHVPALAALGRVAAEVEGDLPAAARYYQRAFEVEPGSLVVANVAGLLLSTIGRMEDAVALLEYRVAHDPANATAHNNLGGILYTARRWDDSIASVRTALRLSPGFPSANYQVGVGLLLGKHDPAGALKECEAESHDVSRVACMALALHALGRKGEADAALDRFVQEYGETQPQSVASIHAYRGQAGAAFEWLEKAVASRDASLSVVAVDPLFDALHGDPRWLPFLRKIGYAPEQVAKIELKASLPQ